MAIRPRHHDAALARLAGADRLELPGQQGDEPGGVKTDRGPGAKPRTFELLRSSGLQGGETTMELYLWEVSAVKAACAKEGEATVDSVSVKMTLLCEGGQRFGHTQRIPLKVDCKPSTPSQEAVTGLTGSEWQRPQGAHSVEMLRKLSRATVDVSPTWLSLGKSGTLEFYSLLKSAWAPEIQRLRVVRLDEKGQVAERFQPVPLSGSESSPEFKPQLTFTPKAAGTARFALEAGAGRGPGHQEPGQPGGARGVRAAGRLPGGLERHAHREMVYRLVSRGTVEEKILTLQEKKRALFESALGGASGGAAITRADLMQLLD